MGSKVKKFVQNRKQLLNIPDNISYLDDYSFYNCESLIQLVIPQNIQSISNKSISYCNNLKNIIIKKYINNFNDNMFFSCDNVEKIVVDYEYLQQNISLIKHFLQKNNLLKLVITFINGTDNLNKFQLQNVKSVLTNIKYLQLG